MPSCHGEPVNVKKNVTFSGLGPHGHITVPSAVIRLFKDSAALVMSALPVPCGKQTWQWLKSTICIFVFPAINRHFLRSENPSQPRLIASDIHMDQGVSWGTVVSSSWKLAEWFLNLMKHVLGHVIYIYIYIYSLHNGTKTCRTISTKLVKPPFNISLFLEKLPSFWMLAFTNPNCSCEVEGRLLLCQKEFCQLVKHMDDIGLKMGD